MLANQLRQQQSSSGAAAEEAKDLPKPSDENSVGLSPAEIAAARADELVMQSRDAEITLLLAARNELESYLLEMRAVPRRKHGEVVDASALNALLDDQETWLWDTPDASLTELNSRFDGLKTAVTGLCKVFFEKTEVDRVAVEEALSAEVRYLSLIPCPSTYPILVSAVPPLVPILVTILVPIRLAILVW